MVVATGLRAQPGQSCVRKIGDAERDRHADQQGEDGGGQGAGDGHAGAVLLLPDVPDAGGDEAEAEFAGRPASRHRRWSPGCRRGPGAPGAPSRRRPRGTGCRRGRRASCGPTALVRARAIWSVKAAIRMSLFTAASTRAGRRREAPVLAVRDEGGPASRRRAASVSGSRPRGRSARGRPPSGRFAGGSVERLTC